MSSLKCWPAQAVEERLEKKITQRMDEKQQEYVREIKMELIKEELHDVETQQTKRKLKALDDLEKVELTESVMERVRPKRLSAIVGQERAVEAMQSKLASVYPQHLLLYGPPGVGKTTAARIVLDEAKKLAFTPFGPKAPFVETDGTTLRWDSRDMTNPLIGSVHDPIYQGARRDLADTGIPEPKPGLVTEAHGGILFIDEIGEMDPMLLNKLLKVMEDKRVRFESAYYDEDDPNVPQYIRRLFAEGAPADFILIGATTRDPSEINPAIRSRCAEIFFEPLIPTDIEKIVSHAAEQLGADLEDGVAKSIAEFTIEGRKAVNILADTYGLAVFQSGKKDQVRITKDHVRRVAQISRLVPYVTEKASNMPVVGKVFGLASPATWLCALKSKPLPFRPGNGDLSHTCLPWAAAHGPFDGLRQHQGGQSRFQRRRFVTFLVSGQVLFAVAVPAAAASIMGSLIGAKLALTKGAG